MTEAQAPTATAMPVNVQGAHPGVQVGPEGVQTPQTGVQPPPADPAQVAAERLSPKFAALARKEAAAVKKLQAATTKEQQIAAREEALAAREAKLQEIEALKGNPSAALKYLEGLGLTYNDLTATFLNGGAEPPELQIKKLEDRLNAKEQAEKDARKAAEEAAKTQASEAEVKAIESFKAGIKEHIDEGKDKYPFTHLYQRGDLVYAAIDQHYLDTLKAKGVGEVMSIEKAAELTEAYLAGEATKASEILKKRSEANGQPPESREAATKQVSEQRWVEKPIKTLSNALQPSVPSKTRPLTDEERLQNAYARLLGQRR